MMKNLRVSRYVAEGLRLWLIGSDVIGVLGVP